MGYVIRGKDVLVTGMISVEALQMLKSLGYRIRYIFDRK